MSLLIVPVAEIAVIVVLWAFGMPCYTISPKGARGFKAHCFPLRPMVDAVRNLRSSTPGTLARKGDSWFAGSKGASITP